MDQIEHVLLCLGRELQNGDLRHSEIIKIGDLLVEIAGMSHASTKEEINEVLEGSGINNYLGSRLNSQYKETSSQYQPFNFDIANFK